MFSKHTLPEIKTPVTTPYSLAIANVELIAETLLTRKSLTKESAHAKTIDEIRTSHERDAFALGNYLKQNLEVLQKNADFYQNSIRQLNTLHSAERQLIKNRIFELQMKLKQPLSQQRQHTSLLQLHEKSTPFSSFVAENKTVQPVEPQQNTIATVNDKANLIAQILMARGHGAGTESTSYSQLDKAFDQLLRTVTENKMSDDESARINELTSIINRKSNQKGADYFNAVFEHDNFVLGKSLKHILVDLKNDFVCYQRVIRQLTIQHSAEVRILDSQCNRLFEMMTKRLQTETLQRNPPSPLWVNSVFASPLAAVNTMSDSVQETNFLSIGNTSP